MEINLEDLLQYLTVKRGLSPGSIRIVLQRVKLIYKYLNTQNQPLTSETIEAFLYDLKKKGYKNNSINTYVFTLRYLQDYFKNRRIEGDFYGDLSSLPKNKPDIQILTPSEIDALLHTHLTYGLFHGRDNSILDYKYLMLTKFLALTGCRFEEAVGLTKKHLDLEAGYVTFVDTKNHENRRVGLAPQLVEDLRVKTAHKGENDLVFTNSVNKKIHAPDFILDLKRRARKAHVLKRIYPHLFRHSFATQLLIEGSDVTVVASILGHKDIQTTFGNYVHLANETLKKAMYMHPLIRRRVDPREILKHIIETIKNFHLEKDGRFNYRIIEGQSSLSIDMYVK